MKLYAPESYRSASLEDKLATCNGCGTKGFGGWIVPDTLYGLSIEDCCDIHDWMYGEGRTNQDKEEADRTFKNNMLRKIEQGSKWLSFLRRRRAIKYYLAVVNFGGSAFWDNKDAA